MAHSSNLPLLRLISALTLVFLLAGVAFAGNKKSASAPVLLGFTVSPPVRDMPPSAHHAGELKEEKPLRRPPVHSRTAVLADPVVQTSTPAALAANSLSQWEGLGYDFPNFTITGVPPDTNMAVGPNNIVQWVNGGFAVFDKSGHTLYSVDDSTFWGIASTCYQFGGFSDPIVQYDKAADRWIVGEVAIPLWPGLIGQFAQCFAVSTTNDPAGSYNMWAYGFGTNVNDYPKIGLWPDAYYVTWNIFDYNSGNFLNAESCAWNRNDFIGGVSTPRFVCFNFPTPTQTDTYASELPGDWDGSTSPPSGSPEYLMDVDTGTGELHLWKFHVDFANTNNSTLTGPTTLSGVAPFTSPCPTTQDCIPQPSTTQKLDALADRLMYRLAYRNFGDHESLVLNHSVIVNDANGNRVGVRWYEVRSPGGTPTIFQQGTFAPDTDNRWMASIAQDHSGDIAVGYSVSSTATYPSIRYTGRETADTLGTLQAETTMIPGGGYQSSYNRWGDYSAMRIDPTDDCTFWYTTEYQKDNQPGNWYTRIGSFKFPSCGQSLTGTTTTLTSSKNPSNSGDAVTFTATVSPGAATGIVTFYDGATSLGTATLSGGSAALTTSTLSVGTHQVSATYSGDSGYASSTSNTVTQAVNSIALLSSTTTVSGTPNPSTFGQSVTFTASVSGSGGTPTGTVTFLDGGSPLGSSSLDSNGNATFSTSSLALGSHSITARYGGDSTYNGSASTVFTQTVNPASLTNTTTTLTSNRNPAKFRQMITFTASVSPSAATGTVAFYDGPTLLGTVALSSGTASLSTKLSRGAHAMSATYSGDANYKTSTGTMTEQVN